MYHMGHENGLSGERVGLLDSSQNSSARRLLKATSQEFVARDLSVDQKQGVIERPRYGHYALFTNDIGKQAWLHVGNPHTLKVSKDFKTAQAVTTRRTFSAPVDASINFIAYTPQAFGTVGRGLIALGAAPFIASYDIDLRDFLYRPAKEPVPPTVRKQGTVVPFRRPGKAHG